jgi:hypothetical protein
MTRYIYINSNINVYIGFSAHDAFLEQPLSGTLIKRLQNNSGHYCSVKSVPIGLPSLLPPASGIVLDIYPDALPPYRDTDVIFNSTNAFLEQPLSGTLIKRLQNNLKVYRSK